jgi:hypothetical protein
MLKILSDFVILVAVSPSISNEMKSEDLIK